MGWWLWGVLAAVAGDRVMVVVSDDLAPYTEPVQAFINDFGSPVEVIQLRGRELEARQAVERVRRVLPAAVYCVGAKACYAVHSALPQIPLVYTTVYDPERYGITGAQATGVSMQVPAVAFLSQFNGFFPDARRVGVIRGPDVTDARFASIKAAGGDLGLEVLEHRVRTAKDVRSAVMRLQAKGCEAVWLPADRGVLTADNFRVLASEAQRRSMPLLVDTQNMVEAGGLYTLTPDLRDVGRQAASMVRELLDGRAPATIPRAAPERLLVALNRGALDASGLPFDTLLLDFVDIVID